MFWNLIVEELVYGTDAHVIQLLAATSFSADILWMVNFWGQGLDNSIILYAYFNGKRIRIYYSVRL